MKILHRKFGTPAAFFDALNNKHSTTLDSLVPLPASRFPIDELVEAYSQARTDYVIPMPMSRSGFEKYINLYDIDLDLSTAVMDTIVTEVIAMGFVAIRGGEGWLSRIGVVPFARKRGVGAMMSHKLIDNARRRGLERLWMEQIVGNDAGFYIAQKFGFEKIRELVVARRPPNFADEPVLVRQLDGVTYIDPDQLLPLLDQRQTRPSWINQTTTYSHLLDKLVGLNVVHPNLGRGWVIYEDNRFQLRRIAIQVTEGDEFEMSCELLRILHQVAARRDASLENIMSDSVQWHAYQAAGYFETFRRVEMCLTF